MLTVCVNLQMGTAAHPSPMLPQDTKKPIKGHTSFSPVGNILPSSLWDMQALTVYISLWLGDPSLSLTYRIYDYSWVHLSPLEVYASLGLSGALISNIWVKKKKFPPESQLSSKNKTKSMSALPWLSSWVHHLQLTAKGLLVAPFASWWVSVIHTKKEHMEKKAS